MRALIAITVLAAACGEPKREAQPAKTEPGGGTGPRDSGAGTGPATGTATGSDPITDEPDGGAAVDEPANALGAMPVWQAVVDRDRYLLRRNQQAVIAGRVGGEAIAPGARGAVRWLVDENEGNGALAVRIAIAGTKPPAEGDRIAVAGAWTIDDQRRWYWQVASLSPIDDPPPAAPPDPPSSPGHVVGTGAPPAGWKPISKGKDAGVVTFGVIRAPTGEGDGWLVGDDSFGAPFAYLYLPGERPSYGGHDLRHADERWVLKRGVTYWVRIDRIRRRTPEDLARIKATTAPSKW
jgi:hypothetical protein